MKRLFCTLLLVFVTFSASAEALPPRGAQPVEDLAGLLDSATLERLDQRLTALAAGTGVEFAVLTIGRRADFGESPDITSFATEMFNAWGLGDAVRNDGILLVVAARDREVRLALGTGFGAGNEGVAREVIEMAILPAFRQGKMAEGIEAGVAATITRIVEPSLNPAQAAALPPSRPVATGGSDLPRRAGPWALAGLAVVAGLAAMGRRRGGLSLWWTACPSCGKRRLSRTRRLARAATETEPGLRQVTTRCAACGWSETTDSPVPARGAAPRHERPDDPPDGGRSSGKGGSGSW